MDSSDLSCEQCEIIRDRLQPYCAYLIKLQRRMEKRGFIPTDELFQAVDRAYDAAHTLWVKLHYMSCPSGVCREQRPGRHEPGGPFAAWAREPIARSWEFAFRPQSDAEGLYGWLGSLTSRLG